MANALQRLQFGEEGRADLSIRATILIDLLGSHWGPMLSIIFSKRYRAWQIMARGSICISNRREILIVILPCRYLNFGFFAHCIITASSQRFFCALHYYSQFSSQSIERYRQLSML